MKQGYVKKKRFISSLLHVGHENMNIILQKKQGKHKFKQLFITMFHVSYGKIYHIT